MILDFLQPSDEVGSTWLTATSNVHCEKLKMCSEIRIGNFSIGEESVRLCKTEGEAGVQLKLRNCICIEQEMYNLVLYFTILVNA